MYLVFSCTHGSLHSHTCPLAWRCRWWCPTCRPCCCNAGSSFPTQLCSNRQNIHFCEFYLLSLYCCSHKHRQLCICTYVMWLRILDVRNTYFINLLEAMTARCLLGQSVISIWFWIVVSLLVLTLCTSEGHSRIHRNIVKLKTGEVMVRHPDIHTTDFRGCAMCIHYLHSRLETLPPPPF